MTSALALPSASLVAELRGLIDASRGHVAQTVNSELVWLYWQIGHRVREHVVGDGRAAYGEQLVAEVAGSLSAEYGRGFSKRNLHHMLRFAEVFPDPGIVHALRAQLSWTHLREIIALDDPLQRRFYVELCRLEAWSTRTLQEKIAGMLYERTAIAKRPEAVVAQALTDLGEGGRMTPDLVFRDPYVLDFLGLPWSSSTSAGTPRRRCRRLPRGRGSPSGHRHRVFDLGHHAGAATSKAEEPPDVAVTARHLRRILTAPPSKSGRAPPTAQ